jgi:hypothetical protein
MWDRHYHEFEDWQLDWLLEKRVGNHRSRENSHPVKKLVLDLYYAIHTKILYCLQKENK